MVPKHLTSINDVSAASWDGLLAADLLDAGIDKEFHYGLMANVAPGWKLRVLLAQALFANPDSFYSYPKPFVGSKSASPFPVTNDEAFS